MCVRKGACLWRVRGKDKGDAVHAVGLKYLEIKLSVASLVAEYIEGPGAVWFSEVDSSPSTPGETGASVAFFIVS